MKIQTFVLPAFAFVSLFATAASADPGRHGGACREDVKKFCGDVRVSEGRAGVQACLKQHESELSQSCTSQRAERKAHVDAFKAACGHDVETLCKEEVAKSEETPGEHFHAVFHCLKEHKAEVSESCKAFHAEHKGHARKATPAPQ
jgi:hypothetical protein